MMLAWSDPTSRARKSRDRPRFLISPTGNGGLSPICLTASLFQLDVCLDDNFRELCRLAANELAELLRRGGRGLEA